MLYLYQVFKTKNPFSTAYKNVYILNIKNPPATPLFFDDVYKNVHKEKNNKYEGDFLYLEPFGI